VHNGEVKLLGCGAGQWEFPLVRHIQQHLPAVSILSLFPPTIEPCRPGLLGPPFFTLSSDSHHFQPVEACSDTFDNDRTINMPPDMPIWLKLPFPAVMNRKDEPARLAAHDTSHRVKRA